MSTELETLKGIKNLSLEVKELYITRFYGGTKRGASLQITLGNDYIQLDNETVKRLIKILREEFEG